MRVSGNSSSGKAIVVTGGGGSIGAEICERMLVFGASRLLVLENSEPALHAVLEKLAGMQAEAEISGRLADVRDRARIMALIVAFKPDMVFHAAALKHVPLLETDWDEGIKTNVFGSINVADAAAAAGAAAMVMISTDKAIEPVSVLGATKRLAEMYCEALDNDAHAGNGTRLISVRFGNVLASNGSVVPKFKAQIEAGGPVTVTHPDMVRYFMTIREACDLVITAASHALGPQNGERRLGLCAQHGPAGEDRRSGRAHHPAVAGSSPAATSRSPSPASARASACTRSCSRARRRPPRSAFPASWRPSPCSRRWKRSAPGSRRWSRVLSRNERAVIYQALREAVPEFRGEAA